MQIFESTFLSDYLRKLGNLFFRWRSYIPLLLLPLMLLSYKDFDRSFSIPAIDSIYEALCLIVSATGEITRILTIGFVPPGTSGRNTKSQRATSLNTTGIYSITRNPLYLGNYLIILGLVLTSRSWEFILISNLLFIIFYTPIILVEEDFLLEKFGDSYRSYVSRVPCFFPKFSLWNPAESKWSWRMALRREYNSIFAIILSFTIVKHIQIYFIYGKIGLHKTWIYSCITAFIFWLIIRFLRKFTGVLERENLG